MKNISKFVPMIRACALEVLLTPLAAFAQQTIPVDERPTATLSPVRVTGQVEEAIGSAAVQELSGTRWAVQRSSTLGESLNTMAGVVSTYFGPNASRPVVRAQEGARAVILQNGVASLDVSGLSQDHAVPLEPLVMDRVQILRGPAALLYGHASALGMVNVQDSRITREALFDARGGKTGALNVGLGGAATTREVSGVLESGTDRYTLHADGFERMTADTRTRDAVCEDATTGVLRSSSKVCNSASQSWGGAVGATAHFDQGYLGVSSAGTQLRYGTVAEPQVTIGMKTQRDSVQGRWTSRSGWLEGLEGQVNQTQYEHTEFEASVPATRFERSGSDGRLQLEHRPIGSLAGLRGSMGLQWESSRFASSGSEAYLPHSIRSQWALFAYEALPTSWGKLDMGLRAEELHLTSLGNAAVPALNGSIGGYSYHPHSLAVGAQGQINAQWGWRLHGSSNQRAPGDNELFANGPHVTTRAYELGDTRLRLENSNSLESGLEWKRDAHRWGLNAWLTRFSNYISLEDTGVRVSDKGVVENPLTPGFTAGGDVADWPRYAYRQVRARFMGVEMNGHQRLLDQGFSLDWEYRLDVLRATNDTTAQPLPRISPLRWGSGLSFAQNEKSGWTGRLGFDHYARQTRQPVGQVSTGGYTLWNAYASYRYKLTPTQVLDWFVKLDNMADVKAFSATSVLTQTAVGKAPLPGRSIKLGVQWDF